ncbi:hypothetical protein [Pseudonocardia humida]|uniref:Uncharacterized protein n=1 Tax=Pseudonocardia humida TaxID=2800819 RepID=A0ABT1AAL7_9PSEU|nr:hypothetical protein [Pseudonocardia humida]MCO1659689.1 hypothetical protein [Pseudonocardia humida]
MLTLLPSLAPLAVAVVGAGGLASVLMTWIKEHHKSKRFAKLIDKAEKVDLNDATGWE